MKKIIVGLVAMCMGVMVAQPVFAACSDDQLQKGCVNTAVLGENGCSCESGKTGEKGEGVVRILKTVVDVMTVGIGVLGVLGITIVGIQYLTAGGSEEKTRKAKRRMFEIIIGLVAYVLIYALLKWLVPGFK